MYGVYDIIGLIGAALIIVAYLLIQLNKIQASDFIYSLLKALGASLIMITLLINWNLAAFLIEAFWLAISIFGMAKYMASKKRKPLP